jgi:hypothetical protein
MGLPEGVAVGLEGLLDEGLLVGARVGLLETLEGALEALVSPLAALPYKYSGIIECKHID